jgi:hypothetical protein
MTIEQFFDLLERRIDANLQAFINYISNLDEKYFPSTHFTEAKKSDYYDLEAKIWKFFKFPYNPFLTRQYFFLRQVIACFIFFVLLDGFGLDISLFDIWFNFVK